MTDGEGTLRGRRALVTGSTSGIGLGIARALAEAGAAVALNGRSSETEAGEALESVRANADAQIHYVQADLSTGKGADTLFESAREALGGVDILVNNAGVQHVAPLAEFPPDKWDLILSLNLSAAFHATRLALPGMTESGWGRIVNIASAHALVASPFKAAYVAAKHGLLGLTKVTALEVAEHDITCNAICPGYVRTPLVEKQIDAQAKAHGIPREDVIRDVILKPQPNKRFATEEEIGALTVFLCSPSGRPITGAALPVDGGWTAH
ncbi:MAG: 3-hydroxybutyrate dehydrogenase [Alphaproteobacteria bacterium]